MPEPQQILVADDGRGSLEPLGAALERAGLGTVRALDPKAAWQAARTNAIGLVIAGVRVRDAERTELVRRLRSGAFRRPELPVLVAAGEETFSAASGSDAWATMGVYPLSERGIDDLVERAADILSSSGSELPAELAGGSAAARGLRARVAALAELAVPVLVHGEPHTGQDAVAARLHERSRRSGYPLVRWTAGEHADRLDFDVPGTLHVIDVERLGPAQQQALRTELRAWEPSRARERARLVATTGMDLEGLVEAGRLDEELVARLGRFRIGLPDLRRRRADLPELLERFLRRSSERLGRPTARVTSSALDRLHDRGLPGNFLDLERITDNLAAFARGSTATALTVEIALEQVRGPLDRIRRRRRRDERRLLLELYERHGTYTGVARELGITRNAAKYRFAKHGLLQEGGRRPDGARSPGDTVR